MKLNENCTHFFRVIKYFITFAPQTVGIAQSVRAPDCGSGGRRFEPDYLP